MNNQTGHKSKHKRILGLRDKPGLKLGVEDFIGIQDSFNKRGGIIESKVSDDLFVNRLGKFKPIRNLEEINK